nr:hypothetical protein [Bacillus siamensis]
MILNEWKDITLNIQAHIVVVEMPLLNTRKYNDSSVLSWFNWCYRYYRGLLKKREPRLRLAKLKG